MSSDHCEETHTTNDFTERTSVVQEDKSVGSKVGQGVSYVVVHPVYTTSYTQSMCRQWCDEGYSWYEPQEIGVLCFFFLLLKSMCLLGIGETIRGLAIDIVDFGKGSGKTIAADGKEETKEGVRQIEGSLHR